jgi:hypothetical protein
MNPPERDDADNFASFGYNVDLDLYKKPLNGTSIATPLAAGLAARILDFSRQPDSRKAGCDEERVRTRPGMRAILKKISNKEKLFQCISPSLLWEHPSALKNKDPSREQRREQLQEVIKEALNRMDRC